MKGFPVVLFIKKKLIDSSLGSHGIAHPDSYLFNVTAKMKFQLIASLLNVNVFLENAIFCRVGARNAFDVPPRGLISVKKRSINLKLQPLPVERDTQRKVDYLTFGSRYKFWVV